MITLNAVVERTDLPTTSSKPRYALRTGFAKLLAAELKGKQLTASIAAWRQSNLGAAALVFIEVVATDGAITSGRRDALESIAISAGFEAGAVAFVTAFLDRTQPSFRKSMSNLAWGSFAWFAAEPENLIALHDGSRCKGLLRAFL